MPGDTKHLSLVQELRADDTSEGIIEGYVAVWDTVDSYNSRFQRGCFKKTLENRMHKIKVLWNHDNTQPIGKLVDIREDDHGLFVRAQLVMSVDKARETFELIKGEAIDCFSFGFRTIKEKFEHGVQVITEVMLGEISPVVFEANPASKITNVRAADFLETVEAKELGSRGYMLLDSLNRTLDDIWWSEVADTDIPGLVEKAVTDFSSAYGSWAQEIVDMREGGVRMVLSSGNKLAEAFRDYCSTENKTVENISQSTSFTVDELRSLWLGKVIADPDRLKALSTELYDAHREIRSKAVESLCTELRSGINSAEAVRIEALLHKSLPEEEVDSVITYMNEFRHTLIGDK